jgi:hypothetical protein
MTLSGKGVGINPFGGHLPGYQPSDLAAKGASALKAGQQRVYLSEYR